MNPAFIVQILMRILSLILIIKGVMALSEFTSFSISKDLQKIDSDMIYWMYEFNFVMPFLAGILLWAFSMQLSDAIIGITKRFYKKVK